jgi:SAM-dependent methyltransferase
VTWSENESESAAEARVLPPGTILQHLYIRRRLRQAPPGRFVDAGTGEGLLSRVLLDLGWRGAGWDLNEDALAQAQAVTAPYIEEGRYELHHRDWFAAEPSGNANLVVSAMLLEHLDDQAQRRYFERAAAELAPGGCVILLVPGSPRHWGIEDEVAGHLRRYTRDSLRAVIEESGWTVEHLVGLTWPVSNLLLRISNRLVHGAESDRLALDLERRFIASGHRQVPWKTRFPRVMRVALNEWTMRPFHIAQVLGSRNENALVLYCECRIADRGAEARAPDNERARRDVVSTSTTREA